VQLQQGFTTGESQIPHHDWLSGYRGLQTPPFILSLGIELAHSFNLNVSG